jgi:hypothetical protein
MMESESELLCADCTALIARVPRDTAGNTTDIESAEIYTGSIYLLQI